MSAWLRIQPIDAVRPNLEHECPINNPGDKGDSDEGQSERKAVRAILRLDRLTVRSQSGTSFEIRSHCESDWTDRYSLERKLAP
jgi:hypothetical protein